MNEEADLACITEIWVGEQGGVGLTQLCPPGYSVQHQARLEGQGGGVVVVYRDSLSIPRVSVQL